MTVYLIYPHGNRKAAPWSIGNHLAAGIRDAGYFVEQYDWADRARIEWRCGDSLIGHPHDEPGHVFESNLWHPWSKVIAIAPWNGSSEYTQRLANVEAACSSIMPICGPYWRDHLPPDWIPLDMAVDPEDYPPLKRKFNPPGQRKFLYIGCTLKCKGTDNLSRLAAVLPDVHFGHVGPGIVPGTYPWGYVEMESNRGRRIASEYDFVITTGENDANPTTVVEAMSWGLIPVCTPQSGWDHGVIHISFEDLDGTVDTIRELQLAPVEKLRQQQDLCRELVSTRYTWRNFVQRVLGELNN
jgi:glycosyltransferase involved in cell wall biosynthesis